MYTSLADGLDTTVCQMMCMSTTGAKETTRDPRPYAEFAQSYDPVFNELATQPVYYYASQHAQMVNNCTYMLYELCCV